ncbi:MAG: DUF5110 domain-containing protein [Deltaproteobacteria bacterium]|nr:DUF5110 domain-containing protein [Deltaproteobacteria bacterium]
MLLSLFIISAELATALPSLAAAQISKFGPYFLTQELVGQGVWHLQISLNEPDHTSPWPPSPMLANPASWTRPPLKGNDGRVQITGADGNNPTLTIFERLPDAAAESVVFTITPYAPDGQLAGLNFYGERYTHIVGLGADIRFTAIYINHLGHVVMPGGPFGSIFEKGMSSRTSGIQAPACYALGPGFENGAIFINETRPLMWDFTTKPWFVGPSGPLSPHQSIDFFVFLGPNLPTVRRNLMNILGRAPVPPKSVFSPWLVAGDKDKGETYEAFFQNLSAKKSNFETMTVMLTANEGEPPLAEAASSGINLLVTETPYIPAQSPKFLDLEKRGFLVRDNGPEGSPSILDYKTQPSGLIDYTDPAAASYWHSLGRLDQVTKGARLFHLVSGEPEIYNSKSWYQGVSDPRAHSHYAWGSRFSLSWMEGFSTGLSNQLFIRGEVPRLFLLSRSGIAGLGRYGAGLFVSEPNVFFAAGSGQARAHLNMSGVDYYATDISGMLEQFPLTRSNQLYEAWLAKNVLVNLPLVLPVEVLDQSWAKLNFDIKAQLEPYYYSLAHQAYLTGDPIVAPILFYFQDDELARESAFETMLGPYMLVAAGVNQGEEVLEFHLPAGRWYDVHGKEIIDQTVAGKFSLPSKLLGIHVAPLLLRSGAVIPMLNFQSNSSPQYMIKIFPGDGATSFDWYEDNGKNKNYQKGEIAKTVLEVTPGGAQSSLTFTIKAKESSKLIGEKSRDYLLEFLGVGNVGVAYLDGEVYNRLAKEEQLAEVEAGWVSAGTGRLLFKTPNLYTAKDHVIVLH